jgi:hypothetical protein
MNRHQSYLLKGLVTEALEECEEVERQLIPSHPSEVSQRIEQSQEAQEGKPRSTTKTQRSNLGILLYRWFLEAWRAE